MGVSIMTAKEFMESYGKALEEKRRIEEDIIRIEAEIGMPGINYDGMPRGNNISKPTEQSALRFSSQIKRLRKSKDEAVKTMLEVEETVAKLNNAMERKVLRARYIDLQENGASKNWLRIAKELKYSEDGIYRLHRVALKHLEVILKTVQNNKD